MHTVTHPFAAAPASVTHALATAANFYLDHLPWAFAAGAALMAIAGVLAWRGSRTIRKT